MVVSPTCQTPCPSGWTLWWEPNAVVVVQRWTTSASASSRDVGVEVGEEPVDAHHVGPGVPAFRTAGRRWAIRRLGDQGGGDLRGGPDVVLGQPGQQKPVTKGQMTGGVERIVVGESGGQSGRRGRTWVRNSLGKESDPSFRRGLLDGRGQSRALSPATCCTDAAAQHRPQGHRGHRRRPPGRSPQRSPGRSP